MEEKFKKLYKEYDKLQNKYGDKTLDSIYNGGESNNPDILFVFMNPTGRNIASPKTWKGIKAPWIGTKNIWKLFTAINLFDKSLLDEINEKKPKDWDYDFANKVYDEVKRNNYFITNLGKCTQIDARPLKDEVLRSYLGLLEQEIDIVKPKIIITFGNQVSSIILNKKISVGECRKQYFEKEIGSKTYKVFPVYYPVGNGTFNIDKAIEDLKYIIDKYIKDTVKTK